MPHGATAAGTTVRWNNGSTITVTASSAASAPTLTTSTATVTSSSTATLGANITNYNGSNATQYGTIYSSTDPGTNFSATTGNNPSTLGANSTTGAFTDARTGLSAQTQYFYAGYATNGSGTGFSPKGSFYTFSAPATAGATGFTATGSSSSQIDLAWTAATFPGAGATEKGYVILRAAGGTAPSASVLVNGAAYSGVANYLAAVNSAATSYPNSGLAASTQYSYTLVPYTYDGANVATYNYYTAGAVTATGSSLANLSPALSTSPGSISFASVASGSTGTGTQVTPTAANFSGSGTVTVTAPAHFQVSNDNSSWNSSSTLTYSANTLTPSTFWVRFAPGAAGAQSGNVTLSVDNNSATATVAVSGTAYAAAPTAPASWNLTATASAAGTATLNWSAATFANTGGYLVVYSTGTPTLIASPNGNAPGQALVNNGTAAPLVGAGATSTSISGLTPGSTYNFLLVAYNWNGSSAATYNYLTSNTASASLLVIGAPSVTTTAATAITMTTATSGGSSASGNSGSISQQGVVYAKAATSATPTLATNDGYTSDATGSASFSSSLGTGSGNATVLAPQTQYYYAAYVKNEVATSYGSYLNFRTWAEAPAGAATAVSATANGASQINLSWVAPTFPSAATAAATGYFIFRTAGADAVAFTATPGAAATAGANTTLVGAVTAGGTITYSNTTGLAPSTTYNYVVVPYTWDGTNAATYNYYATGYTVASATTGVATSATDAFRSLSSGAWSTASNWESFTNGGWMTASSAPTSSAASISILGHAMTSTGTVSGKNLSIAAAGSLTISSGTMTLAAGTTLTVDGTLTVGGTLTLSSGSNTVSVNGTVNNSGTINLNGATATTVASGGNWNNNASSTLANGTGAFTVNGTLTNTGTSSGNAPIITNNGATLAANNTSFVIGTTGTYTHNMTNGSILFASWSTGSTCNIVGLISVTPSGLGQSFYNLTWNNASQNFPIGLSGGLVTVRGDLKILNTGSNVIRYVTNQTATVTVGGDMIIGGNGTTAALEVAGSTGTVTFNIAGNLSVLANGSLDPSSSGSNTGKGIFNVSGNFVTAAGGTLVLAGSAGTALTINMVKNSGTQTISLGGTINAGSRTLNIGVGNASTSNTVQLLSNLNLGSSNGDVTIYSGATLDAQSFIITGSNAGMGVQLNAGGRLATANANGVYTAGNTATVQTTSTSNTFSNTANYTFNGTSAQTANFPNTTMAGLTLNNAAGVSVTSNAIISGAVVLTDGTLSMGTNNLTLGGSITRGAGNIDATNSLVTFNSASAQTVASASFLSNTTKNLTLNGAGGVTLQGNHTVSNALTLTAGNLSIGSNTLTVGGSMARTSGSVNAATGTVAFTGGSAQTVPALFAASSQYGTLVINNSNGVTFSGTPIVNNLLTLTAGTLTMGGNTLTLKGAIGVGTGNIATNATVLFNGSTPQTIPAGTFTGDAVKNLSIDNSSTGVSLGSNLGITGALTLTTGKLVLGSNTLTVPAAGAPAGSATSYVQTNSTGALKVTGVSSTANFPVGNTSYNPLAVGNTDGLDWSVNVADAITNVASPQAPNVDKAVSRMWNITPSTNPTPTATSLSFGYNGTTDVGASFNNNIRVRVWHYESNNKWMAVSGYIMPATVNGMKSVSMSGQQTFSPFAISNFDAPLPVSLLRFTGKRTNGRNELKWTTASESNNRGFAIERSTDGLNFTQVSFVPSRAAGGNSTSDINYTFAENITAGSKWYYRLKQEDLDGRSKYSAVVMLKSDKSGIITVDGIYPNPVKGAASVRLQASAQGGNVVLQLTDMQGRVVRQQSVLTEAGASTTVNLDLAGLAAGPYHLKAIAANGEASEAVTVVKQ
ncbi:T9SS type A sorting domain-containing protein [Flaviaesturariibacter aridisoli]|uniref:T9SS type A sorting domain-containing protein n=1 Tax=Flaviaesturariibacter aridisoli TaxID=2545761 RepID=A0A4R4DUV1_9BACT|nr:T9SS type A sorting domain-containing protein [Flaviaesturariibacter aridisoli]TCZ65850.1 T9SS type A sorting domain-containing protein [Flaviaesturariibacter aridisoli]